MDSTHAPDPYRDLLAAIRDALDVPRPADYADEHKFEVLQRERVMTAVGSIDAVLDEGISSEIMTGVLRDLVRENPITYRPYEPARPEGGNSKLLPQEPQVAPASTSRETTDVR